MYYEIWENIHWEDLKNLTYEERVYLINLQDKENINFEEALTLFMKLKD